MLTLSPRGQSSKGLTEQPQLCLFCLEFPPSWKTKLADCKKLHPPTASADNAGRTGAAGPWSFKSAVGWGEEKMVGPGECMRVI